MALCTVRHGIPPYFFGPLSPNFRSLSDRSFNYRHHSLSALRQSAANGCPVCKILEFQLKDYPIPQEMKDKERLTMKRALNDPEQALGLWRGREKISHNMFFVVPPDYRRLSYYHVILMLAKVIKTSTSQGSPRRE